jgi:hypothetical protein
MALTEQEELELLELEEEEYQSSLSKKNEPETSALEAAKTGAFSSASLGFLDELAGAMEAGGQAIGVKGLGAPSISETELISPKGLDLAELKKTYEEARNRRRSLEKKAQEDQPLAYTGGTLVGGVATAPLAPISTARGAAIAGGLAGLGTSEAQDLASLETLGDVGVGAVGGAALQKALPVAGEAIKGTGRAAKKAGQFVTDLPLIRDFIDTTKGAYQGKAYSGQVPKYEKELRETAKNTLDLLKELNLKKASKQSDILETATEAGQKIDTAPQLLNTYQKLKNLNPQELAGKEQRQLARELEKFLIPTIEGTDLVGQTPKELNATIKNLNNLIGSKEKSGVKDIALDLLSNLKKQASEEIEGLAPATKEVSETMALFERASGKTPQEYVAGLNEADNAALVDRMTKVLSQSEDVPVRIQDVVEGFSRVKGLKDYAPDVADYVAKQAKAQARDLELAKMASGDVKYFGERISTGAAKLGEATGATAKKIKEGTIDRTAAYVKKSTPQWATQTAQALKQKATPAAQTLSTIMEKMAGSSDQKRTAIMFGVMQNPEYRQLLNEINPVDNEEP